jgi:hypothetical protein
MKQHTFRSIKSRSSEFNSPSFIPEDSTLQNETTFKTKIIPESFRMKQTTTISAIVNQHHQCVCPHIKGGGTLQSPPPLGATPTFPLRSVHSIMTTSPTRYKYFLEHDGSNGNYSISYSRVTLIEFRPRQ